ncbi:MAG: RagB/SusD family nutrient uptake outer membrane protein [Carboxylicivirga sp.]|jgi:hypothetical protein|nr:RagB/SusD family nutrient uptake outer membrane protein [Carboxylicivirga sp.]MCT4645132.1 RagB/SusD family nutrient uptake outer membrane protein [Carboxylicivirga sp.]
MKQITNILACLFIGLLMSSCNDWLDVTPQGEARADDILSNTPGVNSALAGIYYRLIDSKLHGSDLSYGTIDAMAQYYTVDNNVHEDYYLVQFDYENLTARARIDDWWSGYYVAIGQCNQVYDGIQNYRSNIDRADLFEGELLALRAFMHMQVYQLFGPVVQSDADLDQKAIPYRIKFDNVTTPFLSCREVLQNAKEDLTKALELLENDPIKGGHKRDNFNLSDVSYNNILDNRVSRVNYYAVMGLLMRVNQLMLNQSEADGSFYWANQLVTELEDSPARIFLAEQEDVSSGDDDANDLNYSSEVIFALFDNNLFKNAGDKFSLPGFNSSSKKSYTINESDFNNFVTYVYGREPDGAGTDYRLKYWFNQNTGTTLYPFQKYREPVDRGTVYEISYPEVAVLRLSEVYYAMCEAKVDVDNVKALEYLNTLRSHRGLPDLEETEAVNVATYLMRERRKEFMGDGRTFFINKRMYADIEASSAVTIPASKAIFELPIPEDEFVYGPEDKSTDNN